MDRNWKFYNTNTILVNIPPQSVIPSAPLNVMLWLIKQNKFTHRKWPNDTFLPDVSPFFLSSYRSTVCWLRSTLPPTGSHQVLECKTLYCCQKFTQNFFESVKVTETIHWKIFITLFFYIYFQYTLRQEPSLDQYGQKPIPANI